MLKKDADHHLQWLLIDLLLLIVSAPLDGRFPVRTCRASISPSRWSATSCRWRGAKRGLALATWTFKPSDDLAELRAGDALAPPQRQRRFHELADRLRLEHLATFCETSPRRPRDILDSAVKLGDLAAQLGCQLEGDGEHRGRARRARSTHAGPGDITFLANAKYAVELASTRASAVIVASGRCTARRARCCARGIRIWRSRAPSGCSIPQPRRRPAFIATAIVAATRFSSDGVSIGPYVVIEAGARIGARTAILRAHA